jgi:malate synthase
MSVRPGEAVVHADRDRMGLELRGPKVERAEEVLTGKALTLLSELHERFNARRLSLLSARIERQAEFDAGARPQFLAHTSDIRDSHWRIAPVPPDLQDRRVEITGPVERQTIITALKAPVNAFVADFEDSCSPTWQNLIAGQVNLADAIRRKIGYSDPVSGKSYSLGEHTVTLLVRPRGWHSPEKHVRINGEMVSGALLDFALFMAHNAEELLSRGTGPYFYLPKLESYLEARLWNDVFIATQQALGLPLGTIKATVLIETIPAAFEMDEILFELREHAAGLNCGRSNYIFSCIKKFRGRKEFLMPDRSTIGMNAHFLKSYTDLLIKTCHRRGAHAIGGIAAQIPVKHDPAANDAALACVREDKQREVHAGHDGTWIAHAELAPIACECFDAIGSPNQLQVLRAEVVVTPGDLLRVPEGEITDAGLRACIRVGVQYLESWLRGVGCIPVYHLVADTATAEICRAQVWQWLHHGARTSDGRPITAERCDRVLAEELDRIHNELGAARIRAGVFPSAARLFERVTLAENFEEFLTLPAYELLSA